MVYQSSYLIFLFILEKEIMFFHCIWIVIVFLLTCCFNFSLDGYKSSSKRRPSATTLEDVLDSLLALPPTRSSSVTPTPPTRTVSLRNSKPVSPVTYKLEDSTSLKRTSSTGGRRSPMPDQPIRGGTSSFRSDSTRTYGLIRDEGEK